MICAQLPQMRSAHVVSRRTIVEGGVKGFCQKNCVASMLITSPVVVNTASIVIHLRVVILIINQGPRSQLER